MSGPAVSLVVVAYNMARELPRTLLSLSPRYQRGCPAELCEIVVVDNGSTAALDQRSLADLGANLRFLQCTTPSASPVSALNEGLAAASGGLIGVWIDGARLASPGLVGACLAASRLHPRPVLATLNYQLGTKLQFLSGEEGYDQEREDQLLASIDWPAEGYRLFEIAVLELRSGPLGPMLESNALFLPRQLWAELGGYDEAFCEPGGGVANPDAFLRACGLPGVQLIRILGEGTFHQIHGGLSTSSIRRAVETLRSGSKAYLRRRGKPLAPIRKTGWVFDARRGELVSQPPSPLYEADK